MKKILFLLIFIMITFSGCDRQKAVIFFSQNPITLETFSIDKAETNFDVGQNINFVLYNPKQFKSNLLRLQILNVDRKVPFFSVSIAQAWDIEIDPTVNYIVDSFCLYKDGYYVLRIFDKSNLEKPVTQADFMVNPK